MALTVNRINFNDGALEIGRPLCQIACENMNYSIGTRNITEIEQRASTPRQVKLFLNDVWQLLALPQCEIDAELLQYVVRSSHQDSADYWDRTSDINNSGKKIYKKANNWVQENVFPLQGHSLLECFFKSKLGVLLLRGLVNLQSVWVPRLKTNAITKLVLDSVDKQFLQSPLCCLYVSDMNVEVSCPKSGKSSLRTSMKVKRHIPELVKECAVAFPEQEALDKAPADAFTVYGQLLSGYAGCLGDFYASTEEFECRKRNIEEKWQAANNRAQRNEQQPKTEHKWFDNFAGTDDLSKAALKLIVTDAPPLSLWATLSNIKRNLICLVYLCKVFLSGVNDNRSISYNNSTDKTELLSDMAEFVCSYFTQDTSLALTKNFPLRMPKQNKTPYISVKDYIVKPLGGLGSITFLNKIKELGVATDNIVPILHKIEGKGFLHVPFYNALSHNELSHKERENMTDRCQGEHKPITLIPMKLSSWEQNSTCKFSAGIKTGTALGIIVGKSSLVFEKEETVSSSTMTDANLSELAEKFNMLLQDGLSENEAAVALSLTDQQKEKVLQILGAAAGPPTKKMRTK